MSKRRSHPAGTNVLSFEERHCLQAGFTTVDLLPELGFKNQRGRSYFHTCCFVNVYVSQKKEDDIVSSTTRQKAYLSLHLGVQHEGVEWRCPLTLSPGAELPVLHSPGKYSRLKKTEKIVVKV